MFSDHLCYHLFKYDSNLIKNTNGFLDFKTVVDLLIEFPEM